MLGLALLGCGDSSSSGKDAYLPPTSNPPEKVTPTAEPPKEDPVKGVETSQDKHPAGYNESRLFQLADYKKTTVTIGGHAYTCWIADEEAERTEGLMFLKDNEIKANEGMIFAFPDEAPRSFWMHNTLIGLDIAYISKAGKVVSVKAMKALDEKGVPSEGPAMYAVEVKAGVFTKAGIKKGMAVTISPAIKGE